MKVDERFQSLLKNDSFQSFKSDSKTDQYGRKQRVRKSKKATTTRPSDDIADYYDVEGDSKAPMSINEVVTDTADNHLHRLDYLTKLARGEISGDSSSSNDSDASDDFDDTSSKSSEGFDRDEPIPPSSSSKRSALSIPHQQEPELSADVQSNRLAIQNCDWENVSAQDLM